MWVFEGDCVKPMKTCLGRGKILFCAFTFIVIEISFFFFNLASCQLNLDSAEVKGKTAQQRPERQQMSSARPRGGDQGSLGAPVLAGVAAPSLSGGWQEGQRSLEPPEDLSPAPLCVTGFPCEPKEPLLK